MINQHLRRYSARELAGRQWVMVWQQQGYDLSQHLTPGRHLLHFASDTGWQGIIDLEQWFNRRAPQSAALASASWTPEQLSTLFVNCAQPIDGLPPALSYQRLESMGNVVPSFIAEDTYACLTPQGRVWITAFPADAPQNIIDRQVDTHSLPLSIQFQFGYSQISVALLKQIKPGDVVLVNHEKYVMTSQGSELGRFIKTEEGFMFDENQNATTDNHEIEDNLLHNDRLVDVDSVPDGQQAAIVAHLASCDSIKVNLDVIMQQSTLTIAELAAFYRGQIIPCHSDAMQNILLMVNGVAIAKGELVWIEDRLGVEIKDMCQEVGNVSG